MEELVESNSPPSKIQLNSNETASNTDKELLSNAVTYYQIKLSDNETCDDEMDITESTSTCYNIQTNK